MKKIYGLIGYPISHSKSPEYFNNLFLELGLDYEYRLFPILDISELNSILKQTNNLFGLNVTSPYKEEVLKFCDYQSEEVQDIKAANVLKIERTSNELTEIKAYNTDALALNAIIHNQKINHRKALILGTGGAARATAWAMRQNEIEHKFVSREKKSAETINYNDLDAELLKEYTLIVNASPVGMDAKSYPNIPYNALNENNLCFDLIYHPEETPFLKKAKEMGAKTMNGKEMLLLQAKLSWKIWQK